MSSRSCLPIALALLLLLSVGGAIAQEHEGVKWQPWGPHVDEIFMPIKTNYNTSSLSSSAAKSTFCRVFRRRSGSISSRRTQTPTS